MSRLIELAEACERHAEFHFTAAANETTNHSVGLSHIDRAFECLDRAERLRTLSQGGKK